MGGDPVDVQNAAKKMPAAPPPTVTSAIGGSGLLSDSTRDETRGTGLGARAVAGTEQAALVVACATAGDVP